MLEKTAKRIEKLQSKGMSTFDVRNDSQAFYAINLAIVFGQVRWYQLSIICRVSFFIET